MATTVGAFGKIDCAFNNAGIIETPPMSIVECPVELWQKIVDVNLTGVWLSMKYEITQMMKQGLGSIVNTSSIGGLGGIPGLCAYTGTKHGVIGITKTVALECATLGIRVNAVCPATIKTPLTERSLSTRPDLEQIIIANSPMARLGTAEEVAATVLWLCSDAASFITGHALAVDGGATAR